VTTAHTTLAINTKGKGLYPFTSAVENWLRNQPVLNGTITVFVQHTSCSLVIQENADPDVAYDLRDFFERLVPEETRNYRHTLEGPDDMTSHIRSSLTQTALTIPVIGGHMALGIWQGLYLFEHRRAPHKRNIVVQVIGV
jgi:secondary thiamine-phosphate synthase enzyme